MYGCGYLLVCVGDSGGLGNGEEERGRNCLLEVFGVHIGRGGRDQKGNVSHKGFRGRQFSRDVWKCVWMAVCVFVTCRSVTAGVTKRRAREVGTDMELFISLP